MAEAIVVHDLLESVPDAMVAVDRDGVILQINSQLEELFGYTRQELIGQKIEMLVPERFRGHHHEHRAHFSERPNTRRMGAGLDLYARRRDGSEFPVEIALSPVPLPQGMLVLSAIRDISDRKQIEEELRKANEELGLRKDREMWEYQTRLAAIVDSSEDAILGKTLDGILTHWNTGAEHIYGYTTAEMVGKSISLLVPKDRRDEVPEILEKIRRGERVEYLESVRVTKDGRHLNVSISVSPMRDAAGTIVGASVIARNITEKKRAEDQLRQSQKMEAIGRLAGGVAHDFNNILGIIMACTEFLRSRVEAKSAGAQYVDTIKKTADRGATLTRQLLTFSRRQVVQPVVLDLNERLREVSKLLRPLMGDDVEIVILSRIAEAIVEADPGQLDQIVLNLAVNARDAMPHGGKLVLETSAVKLDEGFAKQHQHLTAGDYVMLAVSDTGVGMDQATVSRIFEPFFTTKEEKGTGLGLATVYGIVQQSSGHIWVYSEPGRGTTFRIYLPSAEHKVGGASAEESEAEVARGDGKTILLVEDDEMMRMLTRQMLEEHGYTVVEAKDGQAALDTIAGRGAIDLMLTDVVMRGVSGPELALRLSESRPEMKVVYMSGYTGELLSEHAARMGTIALLEKPFTRLGLLRTLHTALA